MTALYCLAGVCFIFLIIGVLTALELLGEPER